MNRVRRLVNRTSTKYPDAPHAEGLYYWTTDIRTLVNGRDIGNMLAYGGTDLDKYQQWVDRGGFVSHLETSMPKGGPYFTEEEIMGEDDLQGVQGRKLEE